MQVAKPTYRLYKHPPVREAICEFGYQVEKAYDPRVIANLYDQLVGLLPDDPELELESIRHLPAHDDESDFDEGPFSVMNVFRSRKDHRSVKVSGYLLRIHQEDPYHGWKESFRPFIKDVFDKVLSVFEEPVFSYVGSRYINRIDMPESTGLTDCLNLQWLAPAVTGFRQKSILADVEFGTEDPDQSVFVFLDTDPLPDSAQNTVLLDLRAEHTFTDQEPSCDRAFEVLDELQARLHECFEAVLTDRMREVFDK